jgi:hypothetical protein
MLSRTALLESLRELMSQDSVRELLVSELRPFVEEWQTRERRSRFACVVCALVAVAVTSTIALAWVLVSNAEGRHHFAPAPPPAAVALRPRASTTRRLVLGACGTVAGACLTRWSPARAQLRRLGSALVGISASTARVAEQQPVAAVGVLRRLRHLIHALLPTSFVEWVLVACQVGLLLGVGQIYALTSSPGLQKVSRAQACPLAVPAARAFSRGAQIRRCASPPTFSPRS